MMQAADTTHPVPHRDGESDVSATISVRMRMLEVAFCSEHPRLLRYLNHLAGRGAAPDLLQEVFARAAATPRFAEIDHLPSYLTRIARNLVFERARTWKGKREIALPLNYYLDPGVPAEQTWGIEARDVLRVYRATLRVMAPKTRRVFLLRRRHLTTVRSVSVSTSASRPSNIIWSEPWRPAAMRVGDAHYGASSIVLCETRTVKRPLDHQIAIAEAEGTPSDVAASFGIDKEIAGRRSVTPAVRRSGTGYSLKRLWEIGANSVR